MNLVTPRAVLTAAIVLYVGATEAALFIAPVPAALHDVLQIVVGVLIAKFGTVYDYYFGSAKSPGG